MDAVLNSYIKPRLTRLLDQTVLLYLFDTSQSIRRASSFHIADPVSFRIVSLQKTVQAQYVRHTDWLSLV